ncbi:MAG TPA: glycosyltransferase family 2 protein [Candidatus Limnocylindria bacterium]
MTTTSALTPRIAVVIPAYNASGTVAAVVAGIPATVSDIVVVDDASAEPLGQLADPRVVLLRNDANRGVGGATLTGYDAAIARGAEVLVKMDADGQMDSRHLPALVRPIVDGRADYTKGNRFLHSVELRTMPSSRRAGNAGLSFFTKLASGYWPVFDPTNGYTAIHASLVPALDRSRISERFFFETSMLLELGRLRAVVHDVPIPARYQGERSALSKRRAAGEFPPRLAAATWRRIQRQYFIQDFTPVSLFLVAGTLLLLFGLIWGAYHWAESIRFGVAATTGTVMLAVLPVIIGVQLLLQALAQDIGNVPTRPIHELLAAE